MFGLGLSETLVILVVALIVIGPKKLPDLAKSLGKAFIEFKKAASDFKESLDIDTQIKDVKKTVTQSLKDDLNFEKPIKASLKNNAPHEQASEQPLKDNIAPKQTVKKPLKDNIAPERTAKQSLKDDILSETKKTKKKKNKGKK
ncbi:MAG: twin-arginine translocase subunit TatB [Desulfobacterales bacterium]|nr:twin-arginine translocase subunit TatB [Desulfobacterales bacterium]